MKCDNCLNVAYVRVILFSAIFYILSGHRSLTLVQSRYQGLQMAPSISISWAVSCFMSNLLHSASPLETEMYFTETRWESTGWHTNNRMTKLEGCYSVSVNGHAAFELNSSLYLTVTLVSACKHTPGSRHLMKRSVLQNEKPMQILKIVQLAPFYILTDRKKFGDKFTYFILVFNVPGLPIGLATIYHSRGNFENSSVIQHDHRNVVDSVSTRCPL